MKYFMIGLGALLVGIASLMMIVYNTWYAWTIGLYAAALLPVMVLAPFVLLYLHGMYLLKRDRDR